VCRARPLARRRLTHPPVAESLCRRDEMSSLASGVASSAHDGVGDAAETALPDPRTGTATVTSPEPVLASSPLRQPPLDTSLSHGRPLELAMRSWVTLPTRRPSTAAPFFRLQASESLPAAGFQIDDRASRTPRS
jgi:hypothetical protein